MKKIAIIAFLIAAQMGAFYLKSHAQQRDKCPSVINSSDTVLLADETTMTCSKTVAKIECYNEEMFNILYKTHSALFKRYTCNWKKDRYGRYKHYAIYVNRDDATIIINWAKANL